MSEGASARRAVIVIPAMWRAVGNRAAVFALETLASGRAVPTVILPWHLGHGRATHRAAGGVVRRAARRPGARALASLR